MVQPMVDKFSECKFVNCGTVMATGDKQQPISVKKSALRDLPNETRNTILKSPGSSPPQKESVLDAIKASSTPKQQISCRASPARPQPLGSNSISGHLVYVRRKIETDPGKVNNNGSASRKYETESALVNGKSSDSPAAKKPRNDGTSVATRQSNPTSGIGVTPFQVPKKMPAASPSSVCAGSTQPNFNGKAASGLPVPLSNRSCAPGGFLVHLESQKTPASVPVQPDTQLSPATTGPKTSSPHAGFPVHLEPQRTPAAVLFGPRPQVFPTKRIPLRSEPLSPRDQHWQERFGHLQMFLKACDQSNQEEYIQKLRSLSAAGRSRHAYELERRAIQLTLEEGAELRRVRILNVLGEARPERHASIQEVAPDEQ